MKLPSLRISSEMLIRYGHSVDTAELSGLDCLQDLVNVISDLQSDVHHTRALKAKTDQTVQDTIVATRIVDGFRNPQPHGVYLKNHASFPLESVSVPSVVGSLSV